MTTNASMSMGVLLWNMTPDWPTFDRAAKRVDELGYDHLWTWDHLHAIFGEPQQPVFDGWMSLAAWAKTTSRVRLGLLVGANTFRNPGLVAKMVTTLDHISEGRAILGLGGAWFDYEHRHTASSSAEAPANAWPGWMRRQRQFAWSSTAASQPRSSTPTTRSPAAPGAAAHPAAPADHDRRLG